VLAANVLTPTVLETLIVVLRMVIAFYLLDHHVDSRSSVRMATATTAFAPVYSIAQLNRNTLTELQSRKNVLQETNARQVAANLTELVQRSNMGVLQRILIKVLWLANLAQAALRATTSSRFTTMEQTTPQESNALTA